MSVYSDSKILEEKKKENIIIHPFDQRQLNNCSYNVSISEFFFREKGVIYETPVWNPWNPEEAKDKWIPGKVETYNPFIYDEKLQNNGLTPGQKYITIHQGETILAATQEYIGGRNYITTMIKGRSSLGRSLISICGGAGWGDVGFVGRWALSITNLSQYSDIIIPVGECVAQIIFMECINPTTSYKGKYQKHLDSEMSSEEVIKELETTWNPEMILPRLGHK